MAARMDYEAIAPDCTKGLVEIARWVRAGTIPPGIVELAKIRASQVNGCAYCLAIHIPKARRHGVTQEQLDLVAGWPEATVFSGPERAALGWAEAVTTLGTDRVPDAVFEALRAHFTDRQIVELTMAIVEINAWNRLQVAFRRPPETE